jgi:peptidylprolyl isomerase
MKALFLAAAFALATVNAGQAQAANPEDTILMETPHGEVVIELRPDLAPAHAERLRTLTREGFYDGVPFHRVIPGFMAQTGDPTGTGRGGSELPDLPAEFSNERFTRGAVGMARSQNPNSANSQFFIVYGDASWLDGQYTYVGDVVSGMEAVDQIKKGAGQSGMVQDPDRIVSMRMMDDAQ